MLYSRRIGDAEIFNFVELIGPTHDPAVVFAGLPEGALANASDWMVPHHYAPKIDRCIVGIQIWMLRLGEDFIVIDTGVGNAKPRGLPRFDALNTMFPLWLNAAGASAEDVTLVINTHLHGDHVGWNTVLEGGKNVPFFKNAEYWMPSADLDYWKPVWEAASGIGETEALTDSVFPLTDAGLVSFYGDGHEFRPGLVAHLARGHTPGQHRVDLDAGGAKGSFCADVFHSPIQIAYPEVNTPFCIEPDHARKTRLAFLEQMADTGTLIMPCHFGFPHCGTIERSSTGGFNFKPEPRA